MMQIICSGFGGQGVLTLGLIMAELAADEGKNVTWVPAYGSEMRGGAANCTVKISDEPIISPYVEEIDLLVALNQTALEKFRDKVRPGGCVVVNSSSVKDLQKAEGIRYIEVPAHEIAAAEGNERGLGLVIVGAAFAYSKIVSKEAAAAGIESYFSKKGINNPKNKTVFLAGYEVAQKSLGA